MSPKGSQNGPKTVPKGGQGQDSLTSTLFLPQDAPKSLPKAPQGVPNEAQNGSKNESKKQQKSCQFLNAFWITFFTVLDPKKKSFGGPKLIQKGIRNEKMNFQKALNNLGKISVF